MKSITSIILNKLIVKSKQRILIPFYHAVTDDDLNYIGDLYSPRKIADFEKDLDVLLEFYKPISLLRANSYINNPYAQDDDVILYMAFKEKN